MIKYQACLNLGNEAFGTEKTITANEVVETVDEKALAREINHLNPLIPEQVAANVLENFCEAVAELLSMGFAVQLKSGSAVAVRIFPDIHVKGGNINIARAKELIPETVELTAENAAALIDAAGGVQCRVRATAMQPFTDLLNAQKPSISRKEVSVKPFVAKAQPAEGDSPAPAGDDNGGDNGGDNGNGDDWDN